MHIGTLREQRQVIQGAIYTREIGADWQARTAIPDGAKTATDYAAALAYKREMFSSAIPTPEEQVRIDAVDQRIQDYQKTSVQPIMDEWRQSFTPEEHFNYHLWGAEKPTQPPTAQGSENAQPIETHSADEWARMYFEAMGVISDLQQRLKETNKPISQTTISQ